MKNNTDDWYKIAIHLPYNGSTRVQCCRPDNSAIVSNSGGWKRFHCFRCGRTESRADHGFTIGMLAAQKLQRTDARTDSRTIPDDFTSDMPREERVWLAKGGLTEADVTEHEIKYSPSLRRVFIPVHETIYSMYPTGYQARSVHCRPKYLNYGCTSCGIIRNWGSSQVCIVEDMLSAIRVSRFVNAIALIGTHLTDAAIADLARTESSTERIHVWLDPDTPGQTAATKIMKRVQALGFGARPYTLCNIVSSEDPKCLSDSEIQRHLYGD